MNLLGAVNYDPAVAVSKVTTSLLAMTAFDTTNLRISFTIPSHGKVLVKMTCVHHGSTTTAQVLLGCLESSTVRGRAPVTSNLLGTAVATTRTKLEASFTLSGLTPGAVNWDAAYGVEIVSSANGAIKYGGPNNTTTDDAYGGFNFEIWDPQPLQTNGQVVVDANGRLDISKVSGTTQTAGDIIGDTNDIQARLPAALTGDGNIKADTLRVGGTLQTAGDIIGDTNDIQSRLPASLSGDGFMKADLLSIGDELVSGNNATLKLKQLDITNSNGNAVILDAINGDALQLGARAVFIQGIDILSSDNYALYIESTLEDSIYITAPIGKKSINAPQDIAVSDGNLTLAAIASAVWASATRTLTSFGTLITDIWSNITRTITGGAIDTNNDKTSYTLTSAYDAAKTASQDSDMQDVLSGIASLPTANDNAEMLLKYDWTSISGEASRSVINALRKLRNKISFNGTNTLTIYKENGTTSAYTQAVTSDSDQEPFKELGN